MRHSRSDYDRIQDPAGLIGATEPVFLIRAHDIAGPAAVRSYADHAEDAGAAPAFVARARWQADEMTVWQAKHGYKVPDVPAAEPDNVAPVGQQMDAHLDDAEA